MERTQCTCEHPQDPQNLFACQVSCSQKDIIHDGCLCYGKTNEELRGHCVRWFDISKEHLKEYNPSINHTETVNCLNEGVKEKYLYCLAKDIHDIQILSLGCTVLRNQTGDNFSGHDDGSGKSDDTKNEYGSTSGGGYPSMEYGSALGGDYMDQYSDNDYIITQEMMLPWSILKPQKNTSAITPPSTHIEQIETETSELIFIEEKRNYSDSNNFFDKTTVKPFMNVSNQTTLSSNFPTIEPSEKNVTNIPEGFMFLKKSLQSNYNIDSRYGILLCIFLISFLIMIIFIIKKMREFLRKKKIFHSRGKPFASVENGDHRPPNNKDLKD